MDFDPGLGSIALALCGDQLVPVSSPSRDSVAQWSLSRALSLMPGERAEVTLYCAVAVERDGAIAMARSMRGVGLRSLSDSTRQAIGALQQATGSAAADRLINRHLLFAYFYAAARAIDDARWYVMRSRAPWNGRGVTVRDFDALMWIVPAVQLGDAPLARELLLRTCEVHGYAPGRGVNYIDGTPFELCPSTDAVAAYPVAVDRYVAQTGDERIVEDAAIAEALYAAGDDLAIQKHPSLALYRTECEPSGSRARTRIHAPLQRARGERARRPQANSRREDGRECRER